VSVLVIIPARAGSKGLPGKNLCEVGGMSLVARAVYTGRQFIQIGELSDAVLMVDTDSSAIAEEGHRWGATTPFLRPPELASDDASTADVVLHAIDRLENTEVVVLVQPTSPLRRAQDIVNCWRVLDRIARPSVASVTEVAHPFELAVRLAPDDTLHWAGPESGSHSTRRQGHPPLYTLNGAVYITTATCLRQHRAFVIPGLTRGVKMAAESSIDVDTAADLHLADALARRQPVMPVTLAGHSIGLGGGCFVIAEAGVNHNGDVALAHQMVDVAAEAKADAVKFQTFEPDLLVAPGAPKAPYQAARTGDNDSQHTMLQKLALPRSAYRELQEHAARRGLIFLSTPFDEFSADFLESLDVPAFKIPSGEITNHTLLAHIARKGKPLLLSTGMSTLEEVADALEVVRSNHASAVVLLHCVSSYPADVNECNLRAMETLRAAFGVPVGWSDHTLGMTVSYAAVALGAAVLEKHFTLDRNLPGPDHAASLEPDELRYLVATVRSMEAALGDGQKRPTASELEQVGVVRRSLHASLELPAGHRMVGKDLVALRPGTGIPASRAEQIVGRELRRSLQAGEMISEDDLV
jgi:N,N'-diacetyllegionaminate synthase